MIMWWSFFFAPALRAVFLSVADTGLPNPDFPEDLQKRPRLPVWAIVLIVLGAAILCLPVCTIVILAILGPSISNVFQSVTNSI